MRESPPPLVLASSSPYRASLLARLGIAFTQRAPDVDESRGEGEPPSQYVQRLARAKAAAGLHLSGDNGAVCIGSDQAAVLGDRVLGKPGTPARARAQLHSASGRTVVFFTGLAVLDGRSGVAYSDLAEYRVRFRCLDRAEIERYVALDEPLDCAGSFRAEGLGITLFEHMEGDDPNTLIGLPLIALCNRLRALGYPLP